MIPITKESNLIFFIGVCLYANGLLWAGLVPSSLLPNIILMEKKKGYKQMAVSEVVKVEIYHCSGKEIMNYIHDL